MGEGEEDGGEGVGWWEGKGKGEGWRERGGGREWGGGEGRVMVMMMIFRGSCQHFVNPNRGVTEHAKEDIARPHKQCGSAI